MSHSQPRKILHFDTIYSNSTTNPYNCSFKLTPAIIHPSRIYLKSMELPILFNNLRFPYNSVSYSLTQSGITTTYTFTLPELIYSSITVLLFDLNAAFVTSMQSKLLTNEIAPIFSVYNNNKIVMKTQLNSTIFVLNNVGIPLYYLGYNYNLDSVNNLKTLISGTTYLNTVYFSNCFNLNFDNYINMSLNIPCATTNVNNLMCHFKIGLNCNSNIVYFNSESNSFCQDIIINDSHLVLSQLNVILSDRFGNVIYGSHYSFSLGIEFNN